MKKLAAGIFGFAIAGWIGLLLSFHPSALAQNTQGPTPATDYTADFASKVPYTGMASNVVVGGDRGFVFSYTIPDTNTVIFAGDIYTWQGSYYYFSGANQLRYESGIWKHTADLTVHGTNSTASITGSAFYNMSGVLWGSATFLQVTNAVYQNWLWFGTNSALILLAQTSANSASNAAVTAQGLANAESNRAVNAEALKVPFSGATGPVDVGTNTISAGKAVQTNNLVTLAQMQTAAHTNGVWETVWFQKAFTADGISHAPTIYPSLARPSVYSRIGRWSASIGISTNTPLTGTNYVSVRTFNYIPFGSVITAYELGRITTNNVPTVLASGDAGTGYFNWYEISGTTNLVVNASWNSLPTNAMLTASLIYPVGQSCTNIAVLNLEYIP